MGGGNTLYYNELDSLITDINLNTLGSNSVSYSENVVCAILYNEEYVINILKNCTCSNSILATKNIIINLNGHIIDYSGITFINSNGFDITINGDIDSEIKCVPNENNIASLLIIGGGSLCKINGGKYITTSSGFGTTSIPYSMIKVENNCILEIRDSILEGYDLNGGSISNVYMESDSKIIGYDSLFTITAPDGISAPIVSYGDVYLENCQCYGYANHTANAAGNDYATLSRAIFSIEGNVVLNNCQVYGTHSGITIRKGNLKIDGGLYEGYSHGGIYFGSNNTISYLQNSIIKECELRGDGLYDDGVAGTNNAGIYIGGAKDMTIFVDNCSFYGKKQPIVLKHSSTSSYNNYIYLSNSSINLDYLNYGFRNDGNNYVIIGPGNNFDENNLRYKRNYERTEVVYVLKNRTKVILPHNNTEFNKAKAYLIDFKKGELAIEHSSNGSKIYTLNDLNELECFITEKMIDEKLNTIVIDLGEY